MTIQPGLPLVRLADLSTRLRHERIAFALNVVLQDLQQPASTAEVAILIAKRLETSGPGELEIISRTLTRTIAPHIPQARQSGETFQRFGREMRRWVWSQKYVKPQPAWE